MIDLFNLGGTFIRKTKKYSVRSEPNNDGIFLEEVSETSLNSEGVYESRVSTGFSVLDCSHIIRHHTEIGCKCPYCGNLNCLQHCTHVCERCFTTVGNCCIRAIEDHLVCVHCYRVLRAKQAALLAGKALMGATKILLIPFRK